MPARDPLLPRTFQLRPFAGDPDFCAMADVANASFAADGISMVRTADVMRADYARMTSFDPGATL